MCYGPPLASVNLQTWNLGAVQTHVQTETALPHRTGSSVVVNIFSSVLKFLIAIKVVWLATPQATWYCKADRGSSALHVLFIPKPFYVDLGCSHTSPSQSKAVGQAEPRMLTSSHRGTKLFRGCWCPWRSR